MKKLVDEKVGRRKKLVDEKVVDEKKVLADLFSSFDPFTKEGN